MQILNGLIFRLQHPAFIRAYRLGKVLAASAITEDSPTHMRSKAFDAMFLECLDEVLTELLGAKVVRAVYETWLRSLSLARNDIPMHQDRFLAALEVTFGKAGNTIAKAVLRRAFTKLGWKLEEMSDFTYPNYVELMRARILERI